MLRVGLSVSIVLVLAAAASGQPATVVDFDYRGELYEMDMYSTLFSDSALGEARRDLFARYVTDAADGRRRGQNPESVWEDGLTWTEKATFLAITAALHRLKTDDGDRLLDWVVSIEEIHGDAPIFDNNQAFRLYVRLDDAAVRHIDAGRGEFVNTCKTEPVAYDGFGSRHPDFCTNDLFDLQRKTDNRPNVQFNLSRDTRCADIDIDYRRGILHLTRDNSNVLASGHLRRFVAEYCDPGFRLRPTSGRD